MKKIICTLLIALPLSAMAQSGPQHGQPAPDFMTVKNNMLLMINDSISPMKQTRDCVAQSQNSEQLNGCATQIMEHQRKMMARMPGGNKMAPPADAKPPAIEWSEERKKQILDDMDLSIQAAMATKQCLESSSSHEQMGRCMQAAKPKQAH